MSYDFVAESLKNAAPEHSRVAIKQAKLLLAETGASDEPEEDYNSLNIAGTDWDVHYPDPNSGGLGQGILYLSLILIPILLLLGIFYTCYRQLSVMLAQDQDWILTAFKDVLTNRPKGSYPVSLNGMNAVIASMVRFNRAAELKGIDGLKEGEDEFELEGFFEGVDDGLTTAASTPNASSKAKPLQNPAYEVDEVEAAGLESSLENLSADVPEAIEKEENLPEKFDPSSAIFRAYDIRGIVGETLTKEIVHDIGRAFASETKEKGGRTVVVGRDGRLSSPNWQMPWSKASCLPVAMSWMWAWCRPPFCILSSNTPMAAPA